MTGKGVHPHLHMEGSPVLKPAGSRQVLLHLLRMRAAEDVHLHMTVQQD